MKVSTQSAALLFTCLHDALTGSRQVGRERCRVLTLTRDPDWMTKDLIAPTALIIKPWTRVS